MNKGNVILIFLKPFIPGTVKTRLGAEIGHTGALDLYRRLVAHTLNEVGALQEQAEVVLFYSSQPTDAGDLPPGYPFQLQNGRTLGERMSNAFTWAGDRGYRHKILVGTDCPELNSTHLAQAFQLLERAEIAIGPATDGGYYLLGLRENYAAIFQGIEWSTPSVYPETIRKIRELGLSYRSLEVLSDIDHLEDLLRFPEWAEFMHDTSINGLKI